MGGNVREAKGSLESPPNRDSETAGACERSRVSIPKTWQNPTPRSARSRVHPYRRVLECRKQVRQSCTAWDRPEGKRAWRRRSCAPKYKGRNSHHRRKTVRTSPRNLELLWVYFKFRRIQSQINTARRVHFFFLCYSPYVTVNTAEASRHRVRYVNEHLPIAQCWKRPPTRNNHLCAQGGGESSFRATAIARPWPGNVGRVGAETSSPAALSHNAAVGAHSKKSQKVRSAKRFFKTPGN